MRLVVRFTVTYSHRQAIRLFPQNFKMNSILTKYRSGKSCYKRQRVVANNYHKSLYMLKASKCCQPSFFPNPPKVQCRLVYVKKKPVSYPALHEFDNRTCLKFEMKGFIVNTQQEVNMLHDIVKCARALVFSTPQAAICSETSTRKYFVHENCSRCIS